MDARTLRREPTVGKKRPAMPCPSSQRPGPTYLRALLPSGKVLVPGGSAEFRLVETCSGPDAWGRCSVAVGGGEPTCDGAVWYRRDQDLGRGWRFTFEADAELRDARICPVAILRPLGGLVYQAVAEAEAAP